MVPPLEIYSSVWITAANQGWACTTNHSRPSDAQVSLTYIRVSDGQASWEFSSDDDLNDFDKSSWGFSIFDGVYSPDNVDVGSGQLYLKLED